MAPTTNSSTPSTPAPSVHEPLDIAVLHKPFKSTTWKPPSRRNKTLKQVLADASRQQVASILATQANTGSNTPIPDDQPVLAQSLQRATAAQQAAALQKLSLVAGTQPSPTYTNIEAGPSFRPKRHWCDVTGLPASYTDPKTKLRYANKEVYGVLQTLAPGMADKYLELRGANVVLK